VRRQEKSIQHGKPGRERALNNKEKGERWKKLRSQTERRPKDEKKKNNTSEKRVNIFSPPSRKNCGLGGGISTGGWGGNEENPSTQHGIKGGGKV